MKKVLLIVAAVLIVMAVLFWASIYYTRPTSLQLAADDKTKIEKPVTAAAQLGLYVSKNAIYAVDGAQNGGQYTFKNIRQLLVAQKQKWNDSLFVSIKPLKNYTYKNVVALLDEMTINHIKHFEITEPTADELKQLEKDFKKFQ